MAAVPVPDEDFVEVYGTGIRPGRRRKSKTRIVVTGRYITRKILRRDEKPDILLEQREREYDPTTILLNAILPEYAMASKHFLRLSIEQLEPENFCYGEGEGLTWATVASTLSQYADDMNAFDTGLPFGVLGDAVTGVYNVYREPEEWRSGYWAADRPLLQMNPITNCLICIEELNETHNNDIFELPCQHKYHKTCFLKWVWNTQAQNGYKAPCPVCHL